MFYLSYFYVNNGHKKCAVVLHISKEIGVSVIKSTLGRQLCFSTNSLPPQPPTYLTMTKSPSVHFEALHGVVTSSSRGWGWGGGDAALKASGSQ